MSLNPDRYYDDLTTEQAHAQVVFLYHELNYPCEKIATITKYAISTVRNYVNKFINLLDKARKWFVKRVRQSRHVYTSRVISDVEVKKGYCAYVIDLLDEYGDLVYTKIGKANDVAERAYQHITNTAYKKAGVFSAHIRELYYAENEDDAYTVENELRKTYKAHCDKFIRNDRFLMPTIGEKIEKVSTFATICNMLNIQTAQPIAA